MYLSDVWMWTRSHANGCETHKRRQNAAIKTRRDSDKDTAARHDRCRNADGRKSSTVCRCDHMHTYFFDACSCCIAMQPHRDACTALHCTATYAIRTSEKQEMEYGERITIALVDASPCRLTAGDMRDRFGCGLYTHGDDIGYRSKARSVAERRRSADRTHRAVGGSTHSREQLLKEPPIARNEVASSTRKAAITQACGSHTVAAYTRGTGTGEIERNQAHRINAR